MATIIVGHTHPDLDCCVSMVMLAAIIKHVRNYGGQIIFAFVPQGKTYRNMAVDSKAEFTLLGKDRVYHVDTGMTIFDNHRLDLKAESSAMLIANFFNISKTYPEWAGLVRTATEEDQSKLVDSDRDMANVILGWCRDPELMDIDVVQNAKLMFKAVLTNERIRMRVKKEADLQKNQPINDDGKRLIVRTYTRPYGQLGVIVVNHSYELGTAQSMIANCVVRICMSRDGQIRIITNKKDPVDLRDLQIIQSVRAMEANRMGLRNVKSESLSAAGNMEGVAWYALENNGSGKVVSLLHGSDKAYIPDHQRTRLDIEAIQQLVDARLMRLTYAAYKNKK